MNVMKTKKELLAEIQRLKTSEGRAWKAVHRMMSKATTCNGGSYIVFGFNYERPEIQK